MLTISEEEEQEEGAKRLELRHLETEDKLRSVSVRRRRRWWSGSCSTLQRRRPHHSNPT